MKKFILLLLVAFISIACTAQEAQAQKHSITINGETVYTNQLLVKTGNTLTLPKDSASFVVKEKLEVTPLNFNGRQVFVKKSRNVEKAVISRCVVVKYDARKSKWIYKYI